MGISDSVTCHDCSASMTLSGKHVATWSRLVTCRADIGVVRGPFLHRKSDYLPRVNHCRSYPTFSEGSCGGDQAQNRTDPAFPGG